MTRNPGLTAAIYGVAGFAVGFVFGALRELVLIPRLGEAAGHWIEFPLVTGVICFIGYRLGHTAPGWRAALLVGLGGTAVLLAIESVFALGLLGQTPEEYLASFDVTRGALFPYGLAAMVVAPLFGRRRA